MNDLTLQWLLFKHDLTQKLRRIKCLFGHNKKNTIKCSQNTYTINPETKQEIKIRTKYRKCLNCDQIFFFTKRDLNDYLKIYDLKSQINERIIKAFKIKPQ